MIDHITFGVSNFVRSRLFAAFRVEGRAAGRRRF